MMPSNKKKAFVLDSTVVNNPSACFNIIQEKILEGDILINYDFVTSSSNIKLKKIIVAEGVKTSSDIIEIFHQNGENKIVIKRNRQGWNIYDECENSQCYESIIMTLSMDMILECKLKNINCEYYINDSDGRIGIYEGKGIPKINQFKYDNDDKILEKFDGNNWKYVDNIELYGFSALSFKQKAYLDLLLDDKISLVLCSGSAGTGKTFLACLAGIFKMFDEKKYENIVISRATVDIGDNAIGFLPGDKNEKMSHWIQPMKDNLDIILKKVKPEKNDEDSQDSGDIETFEYSAMLTLSKKQRKKQQKKIRKTTRFSYVDTSKKESKELNTDSLIKNEKLKIECISFFRGRTFIDTFCIVDEAQNLTVHEIKTIITRIGKGSKLVMIGDTEQSDLKKKNTDFCDVINKMACHDMVGVIQLDKTVRSDIASLAVSIL